MSVWKIGGSLLDWDEFPARMSRFLDAMSDSQPILIVGGGRAADFLRELDSLHGIGDNESHALALRMLDVTARVVAALVPGLVVVERPETLVSVWNEGRIPVLAPRWLLENVDRCRDDALPATWDVTTDSIAARVAVLLEMKALTLLKSTRPAVAIGRNEAVRRGLVDPFFPRAAAPLERVDVVNPRSSMFDSVELIRDDGPSAADTC